MNEKMTSPSNVSAKDHEQPLKLLSALHQLTLESMLADTRQELIFRILNRTILLFQYDRALLCRINESDSKLLGISGQSVVNKNSEMYQLWLNALKKIKPATQPQELTLESFNGLKQEDWETLQKKSNGLSIVWVPIVSRDKVVAGLWLERWQGAGWNLGEIQLLKSLGITFGAAWSKFDSRISWRGLFKNIFSRQKTFLLIATLILISILIKIPLRIVAPCEVMPKDPFVVTAPLDGVVKEILVKPGQAVKNGDLLFTYDKRIALEEFNITKQQVQVIESTLKSTKMQAFNNPSSRADIQILKQKLKQELIKLDLAEYRISRLDVHAEKNGIAVLDDPNTWRGKPTLVGEKILIIVDPKKMKLRIWLPEDDNITFDKEKPIKVYLNAFPEETMTANLSYIAPNVGSSPEGVPSVLGEAQ